MFRNVKFTLLLLLLICSPLLSADTKPKKQPSASSVTNAFYKYHFGSNMSFTEKTWKKRTQWLSPDLVAASKQYFALPQDPEEPPYIDGDPFTGSQEYPNKYSLGPATISADSARVPITFSWKEDGHSTQGTVVLKNFDGKWLIDDVEFGEQDSLRKMLSDAVKVTKEN